MKAKLLHSLGSLFGLFLFLIALWVMHHELKAYHIHDILQHLRQISTHHLCLALVLTSVSYLIMTSYDTLALRYIQHPLSYSKIALASFIGYAFSNNVGFSMIAGASVRYRLYSAWGLSAFEITQVIAFCTLTLWLGFLALGGLVFIFEPTVIPEAIHLHFTSTRTLGMLLISLVVACLLLSILRKRPIRIREWEFVLPSTCLSFTQIAVAFMDWAIAGSALYVLMRPIPDLSCLEFIAIYLLAALAGMVSQVPGGLGVFETVVLLLLSSYLPTPKILGALLAYRGIYYLLPFGIATTLFGAREVLQRKVRFNRLARIFGQWVSGMLPHVLSFATFVGGTIMLFSGAIPAVGWRLMWLKRFLHLPILEMSHFLGSITGMGLLLLARGLQRRLDGAYILTITLLGCGIVFSLLKGLDYEEAIVLLVILGAILPCRRHFYRKAALFSQRFTPGWVVAIIIVFICSVWLGMFSYKHVDYSNDLWWRFTFYGDAPRFLRATVGVIGVALFFAAARLLRPVSLKTVIPGQVDLGKVSSIVQQSRHSYANLALLGDKTFLFSKKGNAFIMYSIEGRSWVAMGDPIGPKEEWAELVWRFREICDRYDAWSVFYEVGHENVHHYIDLGLTLIKLGEEARVPLDTFSLEGRARKGLRYTQRKLEKEGCFFKVIPSESVTSLLPELKVISDNWLAEKNTREKRFSLGFFAGKYLKYFPAGIVQNNGKIVAFANIWQGADKEELSVDLMRYLPGTSHDVMEYLFIQTMLWGKQQGYRWFNLGMAPLAGLEGQSLGPYWNRFGAFVAKHGEHFYSFQGLRHYKEKFGPEWQPKYLASPGGLVLPRILTNLATLISGGIRGVITK